MSKKSPKKPQTKYVMTQIHLEGKQGKFKTRYFTGLCNSVCLFLLSLPQQLVNDHRIIEIFGLEGTFKNRQVQSPYRDTFY